MREMTPQQIADFIAARPGLGEVLRRAIAVEDRCAQHGDPPGWVWYDVQSHPGALMLLVIAGLIRVVKKGRALRYLLVDREAVRRALR